jgi:hypothetical protein
MAVLATDHGDLLFMHTQPRHAGVRALRHATKPPGGPANRPGNGADRPNSVEVLAVSSQVPASHRGGREDARMNRRLPALALAAFLALPVLATEGGVTTFPRGGEDFLVAAMPPPGWYALLYANRYTADRIAGPEGDLPVDGFRVRVNAVTPRLDWVKPVDRLGADRWGTLLILPLLDIDLAVPTPAGSLARSARGAGDLTFGNGLHWTLGDYQMVNAVDLVVPTGRYDAARLANPGGNAWVIRLSHMGTWLTPHADISYRLNYDAAFENPDTHYRSGRTMYLNLAAGWRATPGTTIGVAGYVLRQVTDDSGPGAPPGGNRLRAQGLGPAVKLFLPGGINVTAKYFREGSARNGPRGESAWIYAALPLP